MEAHPAAPAGGLVLLRALHARPLLASPPLPDRAVHLGPDGPRVGELDEEMVHESQAGQTFALGATTWRILEITRDRVIVEPAPGEPARLPFWKGEGPGRPCAWLTRSPLPC